MIGLLVAVLLSVVATGAAAISGSVLYALLAAGVAWLSLVAAMFRLAADSPALRVDARMLQQAGWLWALTVMLLCLPVWAYAQRPGVVWIVIGCFALSGWVFLLARSSLWSLVWRRARRGQSNALRGTRPDFAITAQVTLIQMAVLGLLSFWAFPLPDAIQHLQVLPKLGLAAFLVVLAAGLLGLARRAMWQGLSGTRALPVASTVTKSVDDGAANEAEPRTSASPLSHLEKWARAGQYRRVVSALQAEPELWEQLQQDDRKPLRRLLALACQHDDVELLRHLILLGAGLNPEGEESRPPLQAAVRDTLTGRPSIVAMLLANGADAKCVDGDGRSALHHAARYSDLDVAAQLLDAGAPLDLPDREGKTPLFLACECGNWRAAKYLLGRGSKTEWPGTEPALLGAASGDDDTAGLELLLRHKSRVNAQGRFGRSALHEASLRGNARIVAALLAAGAEPDLPDQAGATPLMEAIRSGVDAAVSAYRSTRIDINRTDRYRRTALVLACSTPRTSPAIVAALLSMGARSDLRDEQGLSALDHALQRGRWDLVRCIDPDRDIPAALSDAPSSDDESAEAFERLRRAALADRVDLVRTMLGDSPVQRARLAERLLLEEANGALPAGLRDWLLRLLSVEGVDRLLAHALRTGGSDLAAALMRLGGQPSGRGLLAAWLAQVIALPSRYRSAASLCAEMMERGADLHGKAAEFHPLQGLVRLGWLECVHEALARGADPNVVDHAGFTPLMTAASRGDLESVVCLIRAGARIDLQCADGRTALGMALSAGRHALIEWLDWSRWPHPHRPLRPGDLIAATRAGDLNAVSCLLSCGFNVDQRDEKGSTALIHACGGGDLRIVRLLLQSGADVQVAASTGATALSAAIMRGHVDIVAALVAQPDVLAHRFDGGVSPLMLAAMLGRQAVLELLLSSGLDADEVDAQGNTVLHYLARFGCATREVDSTLRLWQVVLATPAARLINQANQRGDTALMLVLGADTPLQPFANESGVTQQIALLLRHGASLDGQNQLGASVLHLAAQRGALKLVEQLLALGAPRGLRDTIGRDAGETALSKGYVDVAAALRGSTATVSVARLLRQPEN